MSYNLTRRLARKKARENAKRYSGHAQSVIDIIGPAGGPTSFVKYNIKQGEMFIDQNTRTMAAQFDKAWFASHPARSHRIRPAFLAKSRE